MLRYVVSISLGAFLLFQVQPIVARQILPWFGGTPSVWTTCMLFFQVVLVLGYAYPHLLISRLRPRTQVAVHTLLLALALAALVAMAVSWGTPIIPSAAWKPQDPSAPVWRIVRMLTVAVGLPYFVLATTSPLLQAWCSRTHEGRSPYRLYSFSNAGSLLALVSYPFLVEPTMALRAQAWTWAALFAVFCVSYAYCAYQAWRWARRTGALGAATTHGGIAATGATAEAAGQPDAEPTWGVRALWVALPALASLLLLAITNQMCQEVAVIPFLWVLPLSLYLLSFIICFDNERWYYRRAFIPLMVVAVGATLAIVPHAEAISLKIQIPVYALTLFLCCMVCHGELVGLKPSPRHLTSFYLAVSVGGALGGVLVGVVAPMVFTWYWELYIGLALCWVVGVSFIGLGDPPTWRWLQGSVAAAVVIGASMRLGPEALQIATSPAFRATSRNFYGVLRVREENSEQPDDQVHTLLHGRTVHGYQFMAPHKRRMATSYYGRQTGVSMAIRHHPRRRALDPRDRSLRFGVTGLGAGTLCIFGRPGDYMRFYEINPDVVEMAQDPRLFTYLADCQAKWDIVLGDARLSLERELRQGSQQYDVLVLDAFNSDAVPAHLLTKEAFELYLSHLRKPDGIICVDVSNRVLDLRPVIWRVAEYFDLDVILIQSAGDNKVTYYADWMLLTANRELAKVPEIAQARAENETDIRIGMWTDDYHNLFQIMK